MAPDDLPMIPFRTDATAHRSPIITMAMILANIAVFFTERGLPPDAQERFLYTYALVPALFSDPELAGAAGFDVAMPWPLITNTFLHGGYLHLVLNMWTLWLFGVAAEDRLGHVRFLVLYLVSGAAGSLAHLVFNLDSVIPALGASGAIAGVLGGFTWLLPRARVAILFPIIIFPLIFNVPALVYTVVWFALQVVQGTLSLNNGATASPGGIAWWAHIGGFVAGIIAAARWAGPGSLFRSRRG